MTAIYSCLENNEACLKRKKELTLSGCSFGNFTFIFLSISSITRFAIEDTEYYTIEDQNTLLGLLLFKLKTDK